MVIQARFRNFLNLLHTNLHLHVLRVQLMQLISHTLPQCHGGTHTMLSEFLLRWLHIREEQFQIAGRQAGDGLAVS